MSVMNRQKWTMGPTLRVSYRITGVARASGQTVPPKPDERPARRPRFVIAMRVWNGAARIRGQVAWCKFGGRAQKLIG